MTTRLISALMIATPLLVSTIAPCSEAGKEGLLEAPIKEVSERLIQTRDLRAKYRWGGLINYSLIDTWIPSKYGISLSYLRTPQAAWEIEYLRGSISVPFLITDLGGMTDQKLSILRRSFAERNSFNFFLGAIYHSFSAELGNRFTSLATNNTVPNADLVTIRSLGVIGGIGNRWQFEKRWILAIDWFSIHIPIKSLKADAPYITSNASEDAKEDVRDVMNVIKRLPTFSILRLQLGVSF